jgi:hypothetical protein
LRLRADDSGDVVGLEQAADRATQLERETTEERDAVEKRLVERRRQGASRIGLERREQDAVADLVAGLKGLKVTTIAVPDLSVENVAALRSLQQTVDEVEQAAQRLVAATDVGAGRQEAGRLRAEIAAIDEAQTARRERTAELARRHVEAINLKDATVDASVAVGRQRVETLQPLVADIYSRLDPHPSFTDLDIEHDIYRKRGTMTAVVTDPLTGSSGNPILRKRTSLPFPTSSRSAGRPGRQACRLSCWTIRCSPWTTSTSSASRISVASSGSGGSSSCRRMSAGSRSCSAASSLPGARTTPQ